MPEDHLDKETSFGASITPTSVDAKARSRTVAAVDRFMGSVVDIGSAHLEAFAARRRAVTDGQIKTISAIADHAVTVLGKDERFAERAALKHFGKIIGRQENVDSIVEYALVDLENAPPSESESSSGPEELSGDFVNRFERLAEDATSDELRQMFGKILAGEIRTPGTFSAKVLRVVGEIDQSTAELFHDLSKHRLSSVVPIALSGKLSFASSSALVSADLLSDPGVGGQILSAFDIVFGQTEHWLFTFGAFALAVEKGVEIEFSDEVLRREGEKPCVPVYVLTDVGAALGEIFPANEENAVDRLIEAILPAVKGELKKVKRLDDGRFQVIGTYVHVPPEQT